MAFIMPIMRRAVSFARVVVGILGPAAATLCAMAIGAGLAERCREESHGGHEFVDRNAPSKHPDVLEGLLPTFTAFSCPFATASVNKHAKIRIRISFLLHSCEKPQDRNHRCRVLRAHALRSHRGVEGKHLLRNQ